MFKPVPLTTIAVNDFLPQAIISRPVSHFAKELNIPFSHEHDDFDECDVAAVQIENGPIFALKHYAGYPENTTTIYLPQNFQGVEVVTRLIRMITEHLNIPANWIIWQRADNPDL